MPDVSGNTLLMAVQAVDDAIQALRARLQEADEDDDPRDDEELLHSYRKAADELRRAYELARLSSSNLPPYDEVLPPRGG